jgi:diguanylate cyclase (GGDEF)-like protein
MARDRDPPSTRVERRQSGVRTGGAPARWTEGDRYMDTFQERLAAMVPRVERTRETFAATADRSDHRDADPYAEPYVDPVPGEPITGDTNGADDMGVADDLGTAEDVGATDDPTQTGDAIPVITSPVEAPSGWSDPKTGTDGPRYWDRLIISETARVGRYKRPVTVVLVEIAGLIVIGKLWGPRVAEHTLAAAARTLSKEIRTSDHIARIEPLRFGLLLTETTEIAAINFVERARAACERDLTMGAEVVKVAFGWASPPDGGDLADALALAARRLEAELAEL